MLRVLRDGKKGTVVGSLLDEDSFYTGSGDRVVFVVVLLRLVGVAVMVTVFAL